MSIFLGKFAKVTANVCGKFEIILIDLKNTINNWELK